MPRTTIILQTKQEPTQGQLASLLEDLLEKATEVGPQPIKAHAIAPKANGGSLFLTATRHTRTNISRDQA